MTLLFATAIPGLFHFLSSDTQRALTYPIFKVGGLAVTPLFLVKVIIFLTLLVSISKLVQRLLVTRLLRRLSISDGAKFALGRFATYLLFFSGLFIGMQSLGVNLSSLVVFGGAVGVGVGLGLQNVVSNFVAGIIILIEQPIRIGDRVQVGDTFGDVVKIAARSTWVRTNDNVVQIIPNNNFIQNPVTNWTANDPKVRIAVPLGVGYESNAEQVRQTLLEIAAQHEDVLHDPAPMVLLTEFGDSTVNFSLLVWTETKSHAPARLKSDLYFTIFKRFNETGISLPNPQRDLHIRSSDIPLPYAGPKT